MNTTMDTNASLVQPLANNWWVLLLRGLAGIGFGLVSFGWPHITLFSLILMFGTFAAVGGVLEIIAAIRGGSMLPRWWLALSGLIALGAAAATFMAPHITALLLIYIIGGWALIHGIFEIIGAIRLRKQIQNEWTLILSGVLSALFGIMVMLRPGAGALGLIWMIGAIAFVTGILFTYFAFRLRRLKLP
jgi:uncharacterized membrane protein HdeD (DUF308 family)